MSTNDVSGGAGIGGGGAVSAATTSSGAKITHVKSSMSTPTGAGAAHDVAGINVGVSSAGTLKMANAITPTVSQPLLLQQHPASTSTTTAAAIRALNTGGVGGPSTQVRVVMPSGIMPTAMMKQIESAAAAGRTQITAIPAAVSRTVSNTSITVSRPLTQTTYLPRATATQMATSGGIVGGLSSLTAASVGGGAQRLITPMRTAPTSIAGGGVVAAGSSLSTGAAAGSFIRGTAVGRNINATGTAVSCSSSPGIGSVSAAATTVISPASSTTWMAANTSGQVQLIRAIPHQSRQRIITTTTQGISGLGGGNVGVGTMVAASSANVQQQQSQQQQQQTQGGSSSLGTPTLQAVVSSQQQQQQQQQTYVATLATVLPPRQHQATLVYSSNMAGAVAASSTVAQQQQQQFNSVVASGGQRFAVATPINAAAGTITGASSVGGVTSVATPRQIRPIPLGKSFSTAKLNTTSISIRTPLPQLTPTVGSSGIGSVNVAGALNSPRSATSASSPTIVSGSSIGNISNISSIGTAGNVIPTTNLSTTRIIQLQQPGSTTQQIIGSGGRLAGNVMLQPIIVNTGKIGYRPPVTMAAKVQPSLTITQLGINKLPATTATAVTSGAIGQQQQQLIQSSGGTAPTLTASSLSSASGQLLTTQNLISSAGNSSGGTTVLPLAITTRGGPGGVGNILTGTITPIKNASGITVGKMMTQADANAAANVYIHQQQQQQQQQRATAVSVASSGGIQTAVSSASTSAFLPPGSTIYYEAMSGAAVGNALQQVSSSSSSSSAASGVLSLSTTSTPTSSTISSSATPQQQHQIAVGGGSAAVVVSSANAAAAAAAVSAANLAAAINSLPFATHAVSAGGGGGGATFTVVPSGGSTGTRQLQLPAVSAAGTQIQAVPVRFSAQLSSATAQDAVTSVSAAQMPPQLHSITAAGSGQQLLLTAPQHGVIGGGQQQQASQQQHMVIPLQTSIKFTAGSGAAATGTSAATVVSNFLRKRDVDGSPIRAAKNLGPTLNQMSNSTLTTSALGGGGGGSPAASSVCSSTSFSVASAATAASSASAGAGASTSSSTLTAEALASHKDRHGAASTRAARPDSPDSSDGSTTVSANSSPGVEQQMQNSGNLLMSRLPQSASVGGASAGSSDAMHFNPINELYSNHHSVGMQQHDHLVGTPISSRNSSIDHQSQLHAPSSSAANAGGLSMQRLNGNANECQPRKKSRRSTNDSQLSTQSQASLSAVLPPPNAAPMGHTDAPLSHAPSTSNGAGLLAPPNHQHHHHHHQHPHHEGNHHNADTNNINNGPSTSSNSNHHRSNDIAAGPSTSNSSTQPTSNKENSHPVEYVLRRPRGCMQLHTYKPNNNNNNTSTSMNHFLRYTDVKPAEERRPTVVDYANQPNVMRRLEGFKIHHLKTQMEDLCEIESSGLDHLAAMLKEMEAHESDANPEIARINDLIKGNMQRSKIIVDGVNEAQNQMMKVFEHKPNVAKILQSCKSKRNFKKRDKM